MRLINTENLQLVEFIGDKIPKYAILSHTWGEGEVTFQDWQDLEKASRREGSKRSPLLVPRLGLITSNIFGSTPTVSINPAVPSSPKRLIPCSNGTESQKYVTSISPMLKAPMA
jgi:hypothetical protein